MKKPMVNGVEGEGDAALRSVVDAKLHDPLAGMLPRSFTELFRNDRYS